MRECSLYGCSRRIKARGLCAAHLARFSTEEGHVPGLLAAAAAIARCAADAERGRAPAVRRRLPGLVAAAAANDGQQCAADEECGQTPVARGFCQKHYDHLLKSGVLPTVRIRSSEQLVAPGVMKCTQCEQPKPLEEFYRCRTTVTGRRSKCKECTREARRKRWAAQRGERMQQRPRLPQE